MVGLGAPLEDQFESRATAVSADGQVVVGCAYYTGGFLAFRWTQSGGMSPLGDLPGGILHSEAKAVSADGAVVVGFGHTANGQEPFIWDAVNGMRNLRDVLVNQYGLDLSCWTLKEATGVSADGRTMVGNGVHAGFGNSEGWIFRLNKEMSPCPMLQLY